MSAGMLIVFVRSPVVSAGFLGVRKPGWVVRD